MKGTTLRKSGLTPRLLLLAALALPMLVAPLSGLVEAQQQESPAPAAQAPAAPATSAQAPAAPAPAPAAPVAAATPVLPEALTENLAKARSDLATARNKVTTLTARVSDSSDDDVKLVDLKAQVDDTTAAVAAVTAGLQPRVDQIKARLTELGDPPAAGQPAEAGVLTEERNQLLTERALINTLTGEAEDLKGDSTKLSNDITETRRQLFADRLFKRSDLSADSFTAAGSAFVDEVDNLRRSVGSWFDFVWKFKRIPLFSAIFLSIAAAAIFLIGGYRLFGNYISPDVGLEKPPYITRLSVAFWSTMIQTISLTAFLVTSFFFMQSFNVLRPDIAPIVSAAMAFVGVTYFVWKLSYAALTPSQPKWRLVRASNEGARHLCWLFVAMSFVSSFDFVLSTISVTLGSPVILTVVKSLTASIIIAILLIVMSFLRPVMNESGNPDDKGRRWPRLMAFLLRLVSIALILSCLTGFIGLARFISGQIILTGAVLSTMYIGILCGKAVAKRNSFAETQVGRYLQTRYKSGPVAMDQLGLVAGLAIYAFALLMGIPLILLSWGFQIRDLEQWAIKLFTQITIGNISISLVGILGGILIFCVGLLATRWFQKWLDGNVMERSQVDAGVRNSVKTGIGYLGVAVAGLIGISAAGLDLSSFALVAGALSLGVGFGLQNIVSNFVSGLILLVERPFKVGDWVVTGTTEGFVKRISVRATEIETFQRQSIMVPNSLFINASVGNWTHRNKLGRADISVLVNYDSDPRRVMQLLGEIAEAHPLVLRNPAPMTVFGTFGETTMTFELRVYLADIVSGAAVRNDLRLAIYERFRSEGLGMPFKTEEPVLDAEDVTDIEEPVDDTVPKPVVTAAATVNAQTSKS